MKERLIKANKLRNAFLGLHNCYNGFSDTYDKAIIIDTVDEQPTVEAIPIEYIQKWNNNYIADTMRNGRTIINQMLEDWEKENDKG